MWEPISVAECRRLLTPIEVQLDTDVEALRASLYALARLVLAARRTYDPSAVAECEALPQGERRMCASGPRVDNYQETGHAETT